LVELSNKSILLQRVTLRARAAEKKHSRKLHSSISRERPSGRIIPEV